jgi:hypothetical protein
VSNALEATASLRPVVNQAPAFEFNYKRFAKALVSAMQSAPPRRRTIKHSDGSQSIIEDAIVENTESDGDMLPLPGPLDFKALQAERQQEE